ncbi:hypothetical protein D1007_20107 [Hordeum vulgare]|nr:hypothetical protein D1007_20107 [Hordeum vulgare]
MGGLPSARSSAQKVPSERKEVQRDLKQGSPRNKSHQYPKRATETHTTTEADAAKTEGTAAAGEPDGQDAPAEFRIDHAEAEDDSAPPAVESVLNAKDGESEKSAATEVVAPKEQQDGDNAPAESSGSDELPRHVESVSVVLESEGSVEQSKGEEVVAEIMKPGTDGSAISGVTGQHDADTSVTTADPVINADEGNHDHAAITQLVE